MTEKGPMPKRGRSLEVLRVIRNRIAAGVYPLDTKLPSERSLAEEFEVSRVTIRKSLESLQDDGMITRRPGLGNIISAVEPVEPSVSPNIGFVVQQLSNPYYSAFASELEIILRNNDLNMTLVGTGQNPQEELHCLDKLGEQQVRGVLLCTPDQLHNPDAVAAFLKRRLPVVVIGARQKGVAVDTVDSDNLSGMTAAIDHLLELGHTRIGFLSAMAFERRDERRELTAEILRSKGLEPGKIVNVDSPDLAGGRLALDKLLEENNPPTAVLCTNDITAIGAVQRAFEKGISIPGELSIVGYDDIPMAGMTSVPLTTVAVPLDELAGLAFERLSARADGYSGNAIPLVVAPRPVVRAPTGAPRDEKR